MYLNPTLSGHKSKNLLLINQERNKIIDRTAQNPMRALLVRLRKTSRLCFYICCACACACAVYLSVDGFSLFLFYLLSLFPFNMSDEEHHFESHTVGAWKTFPSKPVLTIRFDVFNLVILLMIYQVLHRFVFAIPTQPILSILIIQFSLVLLLLLYIYFFTQILSEILIFI